jgi:hypothetical protein
MCRILIISLIGFQLLSSSNAWAGGSSEKVFVESLTQSSETDFVLVVKVVQSNSSYKDPYFGECVQFQVIGSYNRLYSWWTFPSDVTRQAHLDSLAALMKAKETNSPIELGWMGSGFKVSNTANSCVVESRALKIFEQNGSKSILSFFERV